MSWTEEKKKDPEEKDKENRDQDDYEAYCYCEEYLAEQSRDEEEEDNWRTLD